MNNFNCGKSKKYFPNFSKKIFSCFMLIFFALISCVVFSACGSDYGKLKINFYSTSGEVIEELKFVIDENQPNTTQRIGIEFSGIDDSDVGQIKVYSLPNELIVDSNYSYSANMCYVDISPVMPSSSGAKLVATHLASGKSKQIDLKIEQKSSNLQITNSKYIISIPEEDTIEHVVDFSKLLNLMPIGSTDKIFFKILNNPMNVETIGADVETLQDVYKGFKVNSSLTDSTDETCVKIYPVTYLEDYNDENTDKYKNKVISVYFKHTLNSDNLFIEPVEEIPADEIDYYLNNLQLLANDVNLNSFKLTLKHQNTPLINTNFFEMYEIETISQDEQKISALVDSNNDIVVVANVNTEQLIEVKIVLKPRYIGDIQKVEKSIYVKGEVKSDNIHVKKNGEEVNTDEKINIFNYYEEGNALGALFNFKAVSNNGVEVHKNLKKMQIVVHPSILSENNALEYPDSVEVDNKAYSLMFHLYNDYLMFNYDQNSEMMVSDPFDENARIYIKYVDGKGDVESADFGIKVQTINESTLINWKNLKTTEQEIDFNRLEGVKSMSLEAGVYGETNNNQGEYTSVGQNPEYVYLNVLEGLGLDDEIKYISVDNNSVKGIDGSSIPIVDFEVEIKPLFEAENPLGIFLGLAEESDRAEFKVTYTYNASIVQDIITLMIREDTSIGDYEITFYQEGIKKASVICRTYKALESLDGNNILLDKTALKNVDYKETYDSDYIVASNQELNISINLSQDVLDSKIVKEYDFEFVIGTSLEDAEKLNEYFEITHDYSSFNNAKLKFLKGSYIGSSPSYVYLTVDVRTKKYDNIVTESSEYCSTKYTISFFVYEEISNEDISLNHTSMTRYFNKYLGVYYTEYSLANLKVEMDDEDLWKYVTPRESEKLVDWKIDNNAGVVVDEEQAKNDLEFVLHFKDNESNSFVRVVKAYVYQFDKVFELQCVFNVEKPIISERLTIQSDINIRDNNELSYYINLKEGESYQLIANNYSSKGNVTHPETIIQVADEAGSAYVGREYFDVDQTNGIITVNKIPTVKNNEPLPKFKLIVFAKDALKYIPSSDKSGYNNPSSFMLDYSGYEQGLYNKAYFVVDIELSNGTEEHPYLITNANDFWQIDDTEEFKKAHYKLMTSISLNNTSDTNEKIISEFDGSIVTDLDNIYTIDGIQLEDNSLFRLLGESAKISNIKYVVNYDYDLTSSQKSEEFLGLVSKNYGTLKDISVVVNGQASFKLDLVTFYFGGLVGDNYGTISYTTTAGVIGSISLSGSSQTCFGGLVGRNFGKILGCEQVQQNSEDKVILNISSGRENALSQIKINSELTHPSSAIGGVVGLNTYSEELSKIGVIQNAFVQTEIIAENTSNVGGVIGVNNQKINSLKIKTSNQEYIAAVDNLLITETTDDVVTRKFIDNAIYNVKSASTIKAKDNVGGIVGADTNGVYIECDYQILSSEVKEIYIVAQNNVGGIAGKSTYGKFAYCSVMSYWWNYAGLKDDVSTIVTDVEDISGYDYVGGIVGYAVSSINPHKWEDESGNQVSSVDIQNRVMVVYSSVNAYLKATKEDASVKTGNIGGILSSGSTNNNKYTAIIFSAYFIGKLEGNVCYETHITQAGTYYLCLDNNLSSVYNMVYSLNLEGSSESPILKYGYIENGGVLAVRPEMKDDDWDDAGNWDPNHDYWWGNKYINGGYIFITPEKDGGLPIFDLSPDEIKVSVRNAKAVGLEKVLVLDYYDFSQNTTLNDVQLAKLNEIWNRNKKVLDELTFEVTPKGLGTTVINVKTTNSNVVDITFDGRLLINGVGECELIFSSVLNPNAGDVSERTIKVVVDYPIGDEFNIGTSKTDTSKIIRDTINIAKGTSKQLYVLTKGSVEYDFNNDILEETYEYKTKNTTNLNISISSKTISLITDYIQVSGVEGKLQDNTLIVKLDKKTPFVMSVIKMLETELFNVSISPYEVINGIEFSYKDDANKDIVFNFALSTKEGATNVAFSYDDAVVYPNDTVYLTAYISSDVAICGNLDGTIDVDGLQSKINEMLKDLKYINNLLLSVNANDKVSFNLIVDSSSYEDEKQIQTIVFRIEFDEMTLSQEEQLIIQLNTQYGNSADVVYTIIPQRINKIEIKNYYNKNVGTEDEPKYELVLDDVLKPNFPGYMIIDMVPDNAYYSYLEISDITGDEEILFIQVDEDGNAISLGYDPSSEGKGIKLYGQSNRSRILVKTQIDKNYSSKIHTIEVRAYSNNGTLLHDETIEIDVKMLPEITVQYVLPSGKDGAKFNSLEETERTGLYLANGVNAEFRITTANANSELEYSVSGLKNESGEFVEDSELISKYSFVQDIGDFYVMKRDDSPIDETDNGKKIRITFTTYAYMDNGDFEKAECSIEFTIVEFVVHSVSVNSSIDNSETTELYGYFDKEIKLNFYFDKDDISFYDEEAENEPYWDTIYTYESEIEKEYATNSSKYQIYSILRDLNSYDSEGTNRYLLLNNNVKDISGDYVTDGLDFSKITLKNNKIIVKEDYNLDGDKYLATRFELSYVKDEINPDKTGWKISVEKNDKSIYSYEIDKNYFLNFKRATAWYEPTVVHNEEDFLEMTSGGRYILAKDIVLKSYVPLDVNLLEFDGNGRTITIQSFGLFEEENMQVGLFRQIYEDMIVKNVVVNYETQRVNGNWTLGNVNDNEMIYTDLCNATVNYSSLNFGGVAAINNGIITNCYVKGCVAVNASTIEEKKFSNEGNYEISFYAGGLVAENSSTGYITNSTTELNIFAQANIGAFAYSNSGKIVSCGVEENTTIYGYNTSLEKTIVVKIAGFVVQNSAEISMCYVNLKPQGLLTTSVYQGTMSAKDISAGFVYSNSGNIEDSYAYIDKMGTNNNTFAGFVYDNSGLITRAYTYINNGLRVNNNDSMFAPSGLVGFENCIEFIVNRANYSNGIEYGVNSLDVAMRYNKTYYQIYNFAFGDNESAVWTIDSGSMPKIVSTQDRVVYTGSSDYDGLLPLYQVKDEQDDDLEEISYKPNFAYYGTKENPYIVYDLETWNRYFTNPENAKSYFRIVKDIDFLSAGDNPATSTVTFKGNIQGNNMALSNIMLYSTSSLDALGLFRNMEGTDDYEIKNAVRNLKLTTTSVWASKTSSVGLLAGMIEDFNIYNITIDAENIIMVGGNAVGGLAGVIRGEFDIDQISSNVGANSTRASTLYNYAIYMSKNNRKQESFNLRNVYYAGSVVGILDGYDRANFNINDDRDITNKKYFMVQNISVNGNITVIGDSVGGAFGLIGERVYVKNANINISGSLSGAQYSAGLAGENRGVIDNENGMVLIADDAFAQSTNVSSGLVGFNLGGLIINAQVQVNILKSGYGKFVGGIVGRNIYGTINNVMFDGELKAYFTGGIMATNYSHSMLINATTGAGTLTSDCKLNNTYLIPQKQIVYKDNGTTLNKLENVSLSINALNYMVESSKEFYSYKLSKEEYPTLSELTTKSKILGLVVALSYEDSIINKIDVTTYENKYYNRYAISVTAEKITFNVPFKTSSGTAFEESDYEQLFGKIEFKDVEAGDDGLGVILKDEVDDVYDIKYIFNNVNVINFSEGKSYVMYLIGSKASSFDSWFNSYSEQYVLIQMEKSTEKI